MNKYLGVNLTKKLKKLYIENNRTFHFKTVKHLVKAQDSGSLTVIPRPAASATPQRFLGMQVLRSHYRPSESETLGLGPTLYQLSQRFWGRVKLENHCIILLCSLFIVYIISINLQRSTVAPTHKTWIIEVFLSQIFLSFKFNQFKNHIKILYRFSLYICNPGKSPLVNSATGF